MGNKKTRYLETRKITLPQQVAALQGAYPEGECGIERHKRLVWRGKIRPTSISQEYAVLIVWEQGWSPCVWVIGSGLKKLEDPDFPHKFDIDKDKKRVRICL